MLANNATVLHINRALRWLVSKKRKSPRRVIKLEAGLSAHKRCKNEWDIIKVAGKISIVTRSLNEQRHRILMKRTLNEIESRESQRIMMVMIHIMDIISTIRSPNRFPLNPPVDYNLRKKRKFKWRRMLWIVVVIAVLSFFRALVLMP